MIKPHMTKDKAIQALKSRAISSIKKGNEQDLEDDMLIQFPPEFNNFLDRVKQQGRDVEFLKASGGMIVQTGLRHVSDDDLKVLTDIMDMKTGRRGTTEDRVLKAIHVMFPTMGMLDSAKAAISKVQEELTSKFVGIYAEEFNSYASGAAMFDNATFIKQVDAEQIRRKTLTEQASAQSVSSVQVATPHDVQSQNCVIS